jgi:hypothetical protein
MLEVGRGVRPRLSNLLRGQCMGIRTRQPCNTADSYPSKLMVLVPNASVVILYWEMKAISPP